MSDLISRQDAIDALQKEINKGIPPFDDVMGSIRCGVRLARNIIEDLPSAEPETASNGSITCVKDEIARILKRHGRVIYCGWNTNGLGKGRGFEMTSILIVSHGGSKNDTLVTLEYKL